MGWLILILIVLAIVWGTTSAIGTATLEKAQNETFVANHRGWDIYISQSRSVLALNRESGQIAIGPITGPKQYPLQSITQIEVLKDGASITSTNRGSQLAGAAIGGLALGGIGLLLGGLSGSKRKQNTIHSIALKIVVDDATAPVHMVEFFKSSDGKGTDARSEFVASAVTKVDHYHALLANALRQHSSPPSSESVASQIARLWDLRQSGALTEDEFTAQKQVLLRGQDPALR